jgi:ABC-2 type transport system ATP-binding protein
MNTATIKVVTRMPIDLNLFSTISSICSIDEMANSSYLVHHQDHNNPSEQIAEIIVNAGWGIQELTPIKKSMEDIFISLTTEQATNSAAEA